MTPNEIEMAASLVSRYRELWRAIVEIPKNEPDMLRLELRYLGRENNNLQLSEKIITLAYCGANVPDMIEKLGVLADVAAMRLAEFGIDARDIV